MKIKVEINGEEKEIEMEELNDYSSSGIVVEKNKRKSKPSSINEIKGRITGATPLIVTAVYLLIGFTTHVWHPTWLLFLLIPLVPIVLYGIGNGKKSITGIVTILTVISYFILGCFGYWHPGWIVFFIIPITGVLVGDNDDDDDDDDD